MIFLRAMVAKVLIFSSVYWCMPALADHQPSSVKPNPRIITDPYVSEKLADVYLSRGNSKKAQELLQRKLGPPCPKCHSTKAVIPIVYIIRNELFFADSVPAPREYEDAFWCRPSSDHSPEQWYCRSCHRPFFDQATGDPIYENP